MKIFISYRRDDTHATARVCDCLARAFGSGNIFRDTKSIYSGEDFYSRIYEAISESDLVAVVIGSRWLDARNPEGLRKLEDPDDIVLREVELARNLRKVIVPVLIDGATMPTAEQLPSRISWLAKINAASLRADPHFHDDAAHLLLILKRWRRAIRRERICCYSQQIVQATASIFSKLAPNKDRLRNARTCPRCLKEGTLVPDKNDLGLDKLWCRAVLSESPWEECGFEMDPADQHIPKLAFPILGAANAGKTAYYTVCCVELQKSRRVRQIENRAKHEIDTFMQHARSFSATSYHGLPHPAQFRILAGRGLSQTFMSLFDHAGTETAQFWRGMDTISDFQDHLGAVHDMDSRRRIVRRNGFIFILDPMGDQDFQRRLLEDFHSHLVVARGTGIRRKILPPVALCISKIDLFSEVDTMRPLVQSFHQELRSIDHSSFGTGEQAIQRRSHLVAKCCEIIWPGWNLKRDAERMFHDNFMMFPIGAFGLRSTSERRYDLPIPLEPLYVLEPLIWLLKKNGRAFEP